MHANFSHYHRKIIVTIYGLIIKYAFTGKLTDELPPDPPLDLAVVTVIVSYADKTPVVELYDLVYEIFPVPYTQSPLSERIPPGLDGLPTTVGVIKSSTVKFL